jgi:hypothetical protein
MSGPSASGPEGRDVRVWCWHVLFKTSLTPPGGHHPGTPSPLIPTPNPQSTHALPHPLRAAMACPFAAATAVSSAPAHATRALAAAPQSVSVARSAVAAAARPLRLAASRSARATRLVARAGGVVSSPHVSPRLTLTYLGRGSRQFLAALLAHCSRCGPSVLCTVGWLAIGREQGARLRGRGRLRPGVHQRMCIPRTKLFCALAATPIYPLKMLLVV